MFIACKGFFEKMLVASFKISQEEEATFVEIIPGAMLLKAA